MDVIAAQVCASVCLVITDVCDKIKWFYVSQRDVLYMSGRDLSYVTKRPSICHKETCYKDVLYKEAEIYYMLQRDHVFVIKRRIS